jgi:hypothetical protein
LSITLLLPVAEVEGQPTPVEAVQADTKQHQVFPYRRVLLSLSRWVAVALAGQVRLAARGLRALMAVIRFSARLLLLVGVAVVALT